MTGVRGVASSSISLTSSSVMPLPPAMLAVLISTTNNALPGISTCTADGGRDSLHDACMVRYRWQDGGYTGKKIVPRSVESLAPIIGPWCELIFLLRAHNNQ